MLNWDKFILFRKKIFGPYVKVFSVSLEIITSIVSLVFLTALILQYGFILSPSQQNT